MLMTLCVVFVFVVLMLIGLSRQYVEPEDYSKTEPELWEEYKKATRPWATGDICLLECPSYQEWKDGAPSKVKSSISGLLADAKKYASRR